MKLVIATAVTLLIAYATFLAYGPRPAHVKIQSQWQKNTFVVEKYFRLVRAGETSQPKIVLVGSSLAERLDFSRDEPCIYNMALTGESMRTGLNAIVKSGKIPKQVFIEINIPDRKNNTVLVEKASGMLPSVSRLFHTENIPMNFLFSSMASGKKGSSSSEVSSKVLEIALESKRQTYSKAVQPGAIKIALSEVNELVRTLESRGTQVVFFEMPIHPTLEHSVMAQQVRSAFQQTFLQRKIVGYDDLAKGKALQTVDGLHLGSDEAAQVSSILQTYFQPICTGNPA